MAWLSQMESLWLFVQAMSCFLIVAVLSVWQKGAKAAGTLLGQRAQWLSFVGIVMLQGASRFTWGLASYFDVLIPVSWMPLWANSEQGFFIIVSGGLALLSIVFAYPMFELLLKNFEGRVWKTLTSVLLTIGVFALVVSVGHTHEGLVSASNGVLFLISGASLLIWSVRFAQKSIQRVSVLILIGGAVLLVGIWYETMLLNTLVKSGIGLLGFVMLHKRLEEILGKGINAPLKEGLVILTVSSSVFIMLGTLSHIDLQSALWSLKNSRISMEFFAMNMYQLSLTLFGMLLGLVLINYYLKKLNNQVVDYIEHQGVRAKDSLLHGISVSAFLCNSNDGTIIECSSEAIQLLGMAKEEIVGGNLWDVLGVAPVSEKTQEVLDALGRTLSIGKSVLPKQKEMDQRQEVITVVDVSAKHRAERALGHLASYDFLTELPNRREALVRIDNLIEKKHPHALLFLDLDNFKIINDTQGHDVGDEVLKSCARTIDAVCSGVPEHTWCARLGGDEFIVITQQIHKESLVGLAQNIIEKIGSSDVAQKGLGVSIGVAIFPEDAKNTADLLRRADAAMYEAKMNGRGSVRLFSQEIEERLIHIANIEQMIREQVKLSAKESLLEIYLQPMFSPKKEFLGDCEVLVRTKDNCVGGGELVQIAERSRLIEPLGYFIMQQALEIAKECQRKKWKVCLSVNVSAKQFASGALWSLLEKELDANPELSQYIAIEITETELTKSFKKAQERLKKMRSYGVGIGLDDFGSGYSSFGLLEYIPLTKLKIDKSLMDGVPHQESKQKIATAAIVMGQALGLTIVSEGIESPEQVAWLEKMNVDLIQGYVFSKPMNKDAFFDFIQTQEEHREESLGA